MRDTRGCWSGRRVLVTGGAGFIGSHLVRRLHGEGAHVVVLDDLSSGSGVPDGVELVRGSVSDGQIVSQAVAAAQAVFHLAAMVSVPGCEADPAACERTNVRGTACIVDETVKTAATLVFASSCAVYGVGASPPCAETLTPNPGSIYAASKLSGETLVQQHPASTSLRFFNVVGAGQRPDIAYAAVAPIFAGKLLARQALPVHGDGLQNRDLVPVGLVVEALLRASMVPQRASINVGTGVATNLMTLIAMLEEATGTVAELVHEPPREVDIRASWADVGLLQSGLGLPGDWASPAALAGAVQDLVAGMRDS